MIKLTIGNVGVNVARINSQVFYCVEDIQLLCAGQTDFITWLRKSGPRFTNKERGIYRMSIEGRLYVIGCVALSYALDTASVVAYAEFKSKVMALENLIGPRTRSAMSTTV